MRFSLPLHRFLKAAGVVGVAMGSVLLAPAAHAQVTFLLTPASVAYTPSVSPQTVVFSGTIANLGTSTVFLNEVSLVLDPTSTFATGNTDIFFNNVPISLAGGESYSGLVFGIDLNAGANSTFFGTAALRGGTSDTSLDQLGTAQQFSGTARTVGATAPEPGSIALAATGLLTMAAPIIARRRRAA